ncbi:MAG: hypothetical protein ACI9BK_000179 [Acidimicrobiales bacterium]|jgi:hypothetical protein
MNGFMKLGLRGPVQIAYAVDDVVTAAESWVALGAGPFFVRNHIPVSNSRMHGVPAAFDHSSAYGQYGDVMVELLCEHHPNADRIGPSAGVHHMAFFVDDVAEAQAAMTTHGWAETLYAEAATTAFAMHDARDELGHLIEIYKDSPRLVGFYDMVRSTAAGWDGIDPVRVI